MLDREAIAWWKGYLHHLDPWREMSPDELDVLYASRPSSPSEKIAEDLLINAEPTAYKVMFCGARGSGKTTELTRIGHLLQDDFAVLLVDVAPALEENAGSLAILVMLGVAALRAAQSWRAPEEQLVWPPRAGSTLAGISERFAEGLQKLGAAGSEIASWVQAAGAVLTIFAPASGTATVAVSTGTEAAVALAQQSSQQIHRLADVGRGPLGERVSLERMEDAQHLVTVINELFQEIAALAGRPVLLLVDGLDRLSTMDAVEKALLNAELFRGLVAPLVFTGPIQVRHHEQFNGLPGRFRAEVLHNLPILRPPSAGKLEDGEGVPVLLTMYQKRATVLQLPSTLIPDPVLTHAARMSAGIVREFFALLDAAARLAMRASRHQVEMADLDGAVKARRQMLQLALSEEDYTLLRSVLRRSRLSSGAASERLLFENYIACYPNGDLWFRPHEILVPYLEGLSGGDA